MNRFPCLLQFSAHQLKAWRPYASISHIDFGLHQLDELNELRDRIHPQQRQEPTAWTSPTPIAIWITCPTSGASCTSNTPSETASPSAARTPPCSCGGCEVWATRKNGGRSEIGRAHV